MKGPMNEACVCVCACCDYLHVKREGTYSCNLWLHFCKYLQTLETLVLKDTCEGQSRISNFVGNLWVGFFMFTSSSGWGIGLWTILLTATCSSIPEPGASS